MNKLPYLLAAYLICAIPFGLLVSRWVAGKDVRKQGSGNTGAANVSRLLGVKWGVLVLLLDALKGYVAVSLVPQFYGIDLDFLNTISLLAVIAHCYSIYLRFKGGKGVATALGVVAAMDLRLLAISVLFFICGFILSRRTSVGSLLSALAVFVASFFLTGTSPMYASTAAGIAIVIWWKHRDNIKRLLEKREPRFF